MRWQDRDNHPVAVFPFPLGGERSLPLKAGSEDALQAEGESAFAGRGRETAPHGGIVGKGELT